MAIQSNFPAIRPSLLLDFANSKRLDPRITFTRASTARYYDGVTVAKAEENLVTQSAAFDDAGWAKTNATVTADQTTAPDGTSTADLLAETATTNVHQLSRNANTSITSGLTYTYSVFLKKGTGATAPDIMQLSFASGQFGATQYANFDINTGVVGTTAGGITASIVSAGSGWYRCIITLAATGSSTTSAVASVTFTNNNDGLGRNPSYAGATTSDVFVWGAQLEQRSAVTAYTATTTQAITNYVPQLLTAQNGVPRFDHNPTTGESLGLLIEEQRTNLCLQSEDLSTTWANTQSSDQTNVIIAPDGTLTGDRLIDNTVNTSHEISQSITKAASAITYTCSVYAKSNGRNIAILLDSGSGTNNGNIGFDLSAGTINVAATSSGTFSAASGTITSVGNGWYRCTLTVTTGTETTIRIRLYTLNGTSGSYAGNDWSGVYLWGAQLEAGAFATSYIPTTAASATRQADAASMTGTNFSSWYDAAEGTLYADYRVSQIVANSNVAAISDNTTSNRMIIRGSASGGPTSSIGAVNGVTQWNATPGSTTVGALNRFAFAYKVDDIAIVRNASAAQTDTSALIPVVNRLNIGGDGDYSGPINGTIAKLAYYPLRLTNAQLQAITG